VKSGVIAEEIEAAEQVDTEFHGLFVLLFQDS